MNTKLQKALTEQVNKELFSAYLYLGMATYCESISLDGFGQWMKVQAQEEMIHAMKIFTFLGDRGVRVELPAIAKPETDFTSVLDVFQKTLAHEKKVTASIDKVYSIAKEVKDNASVVFLEWFITEQVEEEKSASDILEKLKLIGKDSGAILMLDQTLGARPAPVTIAPAA